MNKEEAIICLQGLLENPLINKGSYLAQAIEMAIQALSQEPCDDAISREQVLALFYMNNLTDLPRIIKDLPSVTQKPIECDDAVSRQAVMVALCDDCELFKNGEQTCLTKCEEYHFLATLPSVTQKSGKWIPVNERLPEDEQEILFSTKTGRVYSGKYHDDDSANQWYSHRDKCRAWNNVVIAWMPLPPCYEPQERSDKECGK